MPTPRRCTRPQPSWAAHRAKVGGQPGRVPLITRHQRRHPLSVPVAETDHDDVGGPDQRLGADRVDTGSHLVRPELLRLGAEGPDTGVVGGGVVGDRRHEGDRETECFGTGFDPPTPIRVDLSGQVDIPGSPTNIIAAVHTRRLVSGRHVPGSQPELRSAHHR